MDCLDGADVLAQGRICTSVRYLYIYWSALCYSLQAALSAHRKKQELNTNPNKHISRERRFSLFACIQQNIHCSCTSAQPHLQTSIHYSLPPHPQIIIHTQLELTRNQNPYSLIFANNLKPPSISPTIQTPTQPPFQKAEKQKSRKERELTHDP